MGKLDRLREGILRDLSNNVLNQDSILENKLKSAKQTVHPSGVSQFPNDPQFESIENQNRILKLISRDLSDETSDASILRKLLIIENLKIIDAKGKEVPFKTLFDEKDTSFTITSKEEADLGNITAISDHKFLQTLADFYESLADVYDARQNHRYKMTIKYKDSTIAHSTVLRNYMDTTKRVDYSSGSLVLDLTRGIKLEQQQKIDDDVISTVMMLEEEVKKRRVDTSFNEEDFLFNKIKIITDEVGLPNKDAKKADVLNRFAHQMFSIDLMNELIAKTVILGSPETSKASRSSFFSTPKENKIQAFVGSTMMRKHRIIRDMDTKQNYVEVDLQIPLISAAGYYVCFDSDHRGLKWIPEHQIDHPSKLLDHKEPLINLHVKAKLVPNLFKAQSPSAEKENDYCLKITDFEVKLFSPDLKPKNLPDNIIKVEKDIPKKALQDITSEPAFKFK